MYMYRLECECFGKGRRGREGRREERGGGIERRREGREGGIERRGEVEIRSKGETEVYIINKRVIITTKMSTTCM